MNILPKKSWHVRNKDNIARVRKDEAKAEEEKRIKEERQKLAERESRTQFLRAKARERIGSKNFIPLSITSSQSEQKCHVNFFEELENGEEESKRSNKEHEREKKEETEKYEKQIGYLTYLGQDTNEALGKKNWYDEIPNRNLNEEGEVDMKKKLKDDPFEIMKKYIPEKLKLKKIINTCTTKKNIESDISLIYQLKEKHKEKHKKKKYSDKSHNSHKKMKKRNDSMKNEKKLLKASESDSSDDSDYLKKKKIEILRIERMKREKEEKLKAESLLNDIKTCVSSKTEPIQRKYNSQFNPDIARQNHSR